MKIKSCLRIVNMHVFMFCSYCVNCVTKMSSACRRSTCRTPIVKSGCCLTMQNMISGFVFVPLMHVQHTGLVGYTYYGNFIHDVYCPLLFSLPCADSGVERIDPLCFLTRCRQWRLNLCRSIRFLSVFCCLTLDRSPGVHLDPT